MTEFELCWLSEYLVGTQLVGLDSSKLKESEMSISVSLWMNEWDDVESWGLNYYP